MVSSAVGERTSQYGYDLSAPVSDFEKQPIGKTTLHLAQEINDTLPAHLSGFTKTAVEKPTPAPSGACTMHTRITYNYKHSVSHSYTLRANGLGTRPPAVADGVQAPSRPTKAHCCCSSSSTTRPISSPRSRSISSRPCTPAPTPRWSSTSARAATLISTGSKRATARQLTSFKVEGAASDQCAAATAVGTLRNPCT